MFEHLNTRTRGIIGRLCAREQVELGTQHIGQLRDKEICLLRILASHVRKLELLKGQDLVDEVMRLSAQTSEDSETQTDAHPTEQQEEAQERGSHATLNPCRYRVGLLRARSFRGLAPAGVEWKYDFSGSSHLLYGPNGCGKSSLLGAISYCLTGRIFRDDQPPEVPSWERAYSIGGPSSKASQRPDALALTDEAGANTDPNDEYFVELQLIGEGLSEVWIGRHSETGLRMSPDGKKWTAIESIREAGIDELDAELNLVMPARLPHIRFGKDAELLRILSQIIGLDDFAAIADLAGRLAAALRRESTRIKSKELMPKEEEIAEVSHRLAEIESTILSELPSYTGVIAGKGALRDVEALGEAMKKALEENRKQLAADLGIDIPAEDSEESAEFKKQLENLPGQVEGAVDQLNTPLAQIFANSVGFSTPGEEDLAKLEQRRAEFERTARQQVKERLEWARKERADEKASLMLRAASHFPEGAQQCPVCGQSLDKIPLVKKALEELRPLAKCSYLAANIEDVKLRLLDELNKLVPSKSRSEACKELSERILSDWNVLKMTMSKGLLGQVALSFDSRIAEVAGLFKTESEVVSRPLADDYREDFSEAFIDADKAIADAKAYIQLCRSMIQNRSNLHEALSTALITEKRDGVDDSLRVVLERGRATNESVKTLVAAHGMTKQLYKSVKRKEELLRTIQEYEDWASSAATLKDLGGGVRSEVTRMVGTLDSKVKEYFRRLYENEILELHMLTTGHAANPNVKDEINIYLRSGKQLVPIGPFCNAGRFRALVLSFVFALLDQSKGTVGFTILDDPAVSLDDEHKAKLVPKQANNPSPRGRRRRWILSAYVSCRRRLAA